MRIGVIIVFFGFVNLLQKLRMQYVMPFIYLLSRSTIMVIEMSNFQEILFPEFERNFF